MTDLQSQKGSHSERTTPSSSTRKTPASSIPLTPPHSLPHAHTHAQALNTILKSKPIPCAHKESRGGRCQANPLENARLRRSPLRRHRVNHSPHRGQPPPEAAGAAQEHRCARNGLMKLTRTTESPLRGHSHLTAAPVVPVRPSPWPTLYGTPHATLTPPTRTPRLGGAFTHINRAPASLARLTGRSPPTCKIPWEKQRKGGEMGSAALRSVHREPGEGDSSVDTVHLRLCLRSMDCECQSTMNHTVRAAR